MLVDNKKFKEFKRANGGLLSIECTTVAKILEAPDLKKVETCNTDIHPNGLYLSFIWSYKLYFPLTDFEKVTYDNNVIEIHLVDGKMIKMEIEKEKDLLKFDSVLREHLGTRVEKLNLDREKVFKNEVIKEKRRSELEKKKEDKKLAEDERKKEMERLRNAGRTVSPYEQQRHQLIQDNNVAHCPKCGSTSLSADKKGFSTTKAIVGTLLVDPLIGVVAGSTGKNKVIVTCLKCGHQWPAGNK